MKQQCQTIDIQSCQPDGLYFPYYDIKIKVTNEQFDFKITVKRVN
jgi:hypothetical protein